MDHYGTGICFTIAVLALFITSGIVSVFATHVHNVEDYEWHIWSRSPDDGHLDHLSCDENNDYCALKIQVMGGIQSHTEDVIESEVDDIEAHFDSLNKKMSIDRVSSANSIIKESNLMRENPGWTTYELHCTSYFLWWCIGKDAHFTSMTVKINDNADEFDFQLAEDQPKDVFDVRKTLGHELFHAMGIDHNSPTDSIVHYAYQFGEKGYTATPTDMADLEARYP